MTTVSLWGAQVRVMPRCWFVLLRFWLRVDHVLVRLYETRYLCDFRRAASRCPLPCNPVLAS